MIYRRLLLCIMLSSALLASALADDLSEVFASEQLINEFKSPGFESYVYSTRLDFPAAKRKLRQFLGKEWQEQAIDADSVAEALETVGDQGLTWIGGVAYSHSEQPDVFITFTLHKIKDNKQGTYMAGLNKIDSSLVAPQ